MFSAGRLDDSLFKLATTCPACGALNDGSSPLCKIDDTLLVSIKDGSLITDRYSCVKLIGFGGMGLLALVREVGSDREFALKLLLDSSNEVDKLRFIREAEAASRLKHENIIEIIDHGVSKSGCPFMVMEYIQGEDLSKFMSRRGALQLDECAEIFDQLCSALSYAHSKGIIHRDIKPSNVMVSNVNGRQLVKVVDFGIAKLIDHNSAPPPALTRVGQILGSPIYMSPEQALGKPIDTRTDIYSAACVLYHMLTGAPPLVGNNRLETLANHLNVVPMKLTEASLGMKFSPALEAVVEKALQKDPKDRQASFAQLQQEFDDAVKIKEPAPEKFVKEKSPPEPRVWIGIGLILSLMLIVAYIVFFRDKQPTKEIRTPTPVQTANQPERKPIVPSDLSHVGVDEPFVGTHTDKEKDSSGTNSQLHPRIENETLTPQDLWVHQNFLQTLATTPGLIDYQMKDSRATDESISFILGELRKRHMLARLHSLKVDSPLIGERSVKELTDPNLRLKILFLRSQRITDSGIKLLGTISSLEELDLQGMGGYHPEALSALKNLRHLKTLAISRSFGSGVVYSRARGEKVLSFLTQLPQLEELLIADDRCLIFDGTTSVIAKLKNLRILEIGWTVMSNKGLNNLTKLSNLESLDISGTNFDDTVIPYLTKFPKLKKLVIKSQNITDRGLQEIATLYDSNRLNLRELDVSGCPRVSETACDALQERLPSCMVTSSKYHYPKY